MRSSAEASAALPTVTAAASAVARLCRSPRLCAWYCITAAVVRMVARSMIAGMSSFSRRRAIASTLVIGSTGRALATTTGAATPAPTWW